MYTLKTLKNGLKLILVPRSSTRVVTTMVLFRVGSVDESNKNAGISHFLEHMHYKGTKKRRTGLDVSAFIESIGGQHNAFTGKEYTGYYAKITPDHLENAFDFLSDNLLSPLFDPKEMEKEKGVVIEEINMYEDNPMATVHRDFENVVFGENELGRDIIGTKKSVSDVTPIDLKNYKNKFYSASNAVLVLSGNFGKRTEKEVKALAEKYFTFAKGKGNKRAKIHFDPTTRVHISKKKTEQSNIVLGFKTVGISDPDFFPLSLLATVLGGGMSSRMFEEIREQRGLAYSVKTHQDSYVQSGALFTQAGVPNDKVEEAILAIANEYKKAKEGVSEIELNKAKEITIGKMLISLEDSEEEAFQYAQEILLAEKAFMTPEMVIEKYRKVTKDDILRVAKKYLCEDKLVLAAIAPKLSQAKISKQLSLT